eukprot:TRINITY_DN4348_c0_g1_i4.p1 TRINITY_DN4348_c0_g1~~TRINITY_DN4348_c0_g1_i4.p1  ORF type:complete len:391 (+),score=69.90 TRINITY_DN4348_c0_g1_i4:89-1174(+)
MVHRSAIINIIRNYGKLYNGDNDESSNVRSLHRYSIVKSSTWSRESHGLYDYETNSATISEFKLKSTARLVRKGLTVIAKETREDLDCTEGSESKSLANIGFLHNSYWVYDSAGFEENEDQLALLLRNCAENGVPGAKLAQGDVIKLGRCKFIVKEIVESVAQVVDTNEPEEEKMAQEFGIVDNIATAEEIKMEVKEKEDEIRCRVCLDDDDPLDNPIISSPCNCLGSVKYMHVNCLQKWLRSKVTQKKTDTVSSYVWKEFQCDICKIDYPGTHCITTSRVESTQWQSHRNLPNRKTSNKLHDVRSYKAPTFTSKQRLHSIVGQKSDAEHSKDFAKRREGRMGTTCRLTTFLYRGHMRCCG